VGHVSPSKFGTLRIELKFAKALEQPINVLVYKEFDSIIEINEAKIAIKNY